jgi:hypothetical protein
MRLFGPKIAVARAARCCLPVLILSSLDWTERCQQMTLPGWLCGLLVCSVMCIHQSAWALGFAYLHCKGGVKTKSEYITDQETRQNASIYSLKAR